MPLTDLTLNELADWLADRAPYLSLHSADPGQNGANETTAARVAANWPAAANGGQLLILNKVFNGGTPLGPVTHIGLWSTATGGIFRGSGALDGDQTFNANGVYNLTDATINGS